MSEQKQSSALPLPIQSSTPYRPSWKPRILLGILFLLATAINFGPSLSSVSEGENGRLDPSSYKFHDDLTTRFDIEQLKNWATCPQQPKPIYPNMTWEMTEEERNRSIEHYAQAVVSSAPLSYPSRRKIADGLIIQRIPTQSYDDNEEPDEDPRWKLFFIFQDWLKETYPLAYGRISIMKCIQADRTLYFDRHEKATIEYINSGFCDASFAVPNYLTDIYRARYLGYFQGFRSDSQAPFVVSIIQG